MAHIRVELRALAVASAMVILVGVVGAQPGPEDAGETFEAARDMGTVVSSGSRLVVDRIGDADPADYFRLKITGPGQLSATLSELTANADLYLYDAGGAEIRRSVAGDAADEQLSDDVLAGTYFLAVIGFSGDTRYDLVYAFTPAPAAEIPRDIAGDTQGTAHELGTVSGPGSRSDWVGAEDQSDYFRLEVTGPGVISATLTGLTANADLYLYEASPPGALTDETLDSSTAVGTSPEQVSVHVPAGTYYFEVLQRSGDTYYHLDYEFTPDEEPAEEAPPVAAPPNLPGQGPRTAEANEPLIFVGQEHGARIAGAADPLIFNGQEIACVFPPAAGEVATCHCDIATPGGAVWGTDLYTDDSDICSAAIHAGELRPAETAAGIRYMGPIEVGGAPGCPYYNASSAHGVTTQVWGGDWPGSFYFPAVQLGLCDSASPPAADMWYCPTRLPSGISSMTCHCTPTAMETGTIWGTSVYTADSPICRAARHSGFVPAAGGTVSVIGLGPANSYRGTDANGITSYPWGEYGASIGFR